MSTAAVYPIDTAIVLRSPVFAYLDNTTNPGSGASYTREKVKQVIDRLRRRLPKSTAATIDAGHIVFDGEELYQYLRLPPQQKYTQYVINRLIDLGTIGEPFHVPDGFLKFYNINTGSLDLATGTTIASGGSGGSDPRFIRPLKPEDMDRRLAAAFKRTSPPRLASRLPNDVKRHLEHEGDYPAIETRNSFQCQDQGHVLLDVLFQWSYYYVAENDDLEPEYDPTVNSAWRRGIFCFMEQLPVTWWESPYYFEADEADESDESDESETLPHLMVGISASKGWPVDGSVTIAEFDEILKMINVCRTDTSFFTHCRYVPVTVVSVSAHLLRVVHAWHDAKDPFRLQIRASPVMSYKDPLTDNEDWRKLVCYVGGQPVIEEP